jgi:hypothetical protein
MQEIRGLIGKLGSQPGRSRGWRLECEIYAWFPSRSRDWLRAFIANRQF